MRYNYKDTTAIINGLSALQWPAILLSDRKQPQNGKISCSMKQDIIYNKDRSKDSLSMMRLAGITQAYISGLYHSKCQGESPIVTDYRHPS